LCHIDDFFATLDLLATKLSTTKDEEILSESKDNLYKPLTKNP